MSPIRRRVIREPELVERTGLSRVTIWRLEKTGNFPKRIQLGANSKGWFDDEIDRWLDQKDRARFDEKCAKRGGGR